MMVDTPDEVDRLTEQMRHAGARVTKEPVDAEFFTGRSAYLCDPEAITSRSPGQTSRTTQSWLQHAAPPGPEPPCHALKDAGVGPYPIAVSMSRQGDACREILVVRARPTL